jgi:hypothetical protein
MIAAEDWKTRAARGLKMDLCGSKTCEQELRRGEAGADVKSVAILTEAVEAIIDRWKKGAGDRIEGD